MQNDNKFIELVKLTDQAKKFASIIDKPQEREVLIKKFGSGEHLETMIGAYKDNWKSGDVYLDYHAKDSDTVHKVSLMREALDALGIERMLDHDIPDELMQSNRGFFAALYYDRNKSSYSVAFRGTDDPKDYPVDFFNGLGLETSQYRLAAKLARYLGKHPKYAKGLTFAGHSLGGGLASFAALASSHSANTYNAAGVDRALVRTLNIPFKRVNENINAWYVSGDIVSRVQDSLVVDILASGLTRFKAIASILMGRPNFRTAYVAQALGKRIKLTGVIGDKLISSFSGKLFKMATLHSNFVVLNTLAYEFGISTP